MRVAAEHGIAPIDLVAVNLYPFQATAARTGVTRDEVIENIDISGPSMLRSAAKNFESVTVVVDPADYARVLAGFEAQDDDIDLRRPLARKSLRTLRPMTARSQPGSPARGPKVPDRAFFRWIGRRHCDMEKIRDSGARILCRSKRKRFSAPAAERWKGALVQQLPRSRGRAPRNRSLHGRGVLCAIEAHDSVRSRNRIERSRGLSQGARLRSCFCIRIGNLIHCFGRCRNRRGSIESVRGMHRRAVVQRRGLEILGRKKNLRVLEGRASWKDHASTTSA